MAKNALATPIRSSPDKGVKYINPIDFGSMRREDCLQLVSRAADLHRRPSLSVKRVSLGLGSHRPFDPAMSTVRAR